MATKWATVADVAVKTGITVTESRVAAAVSVLEMVTGLIEEVERPGITDRDRYFLKLATCYQAVFMVDNPDIYSRADVVSASQDGESASYRNADSHLLAPLARKAIRRLSWRTRPGLGSSALASASDLDALDDRLPWAPL